MRADRRAVVAGLGLLPFAAQARATDPWTQADAIVAGIARPRIPSRRISIVAHGARPDGSLATDAIHAAIAALARAGGGRVVVPPGRFLTGPIRLQSNIELHLAAGATLAFSTDARLFPIVLTRFEGVELMGLAPLIGAHGCHDIAITGAGTLDGQASGEHWWRWKGPWKGTVDGGWREGQPDQRPARARLFAMAEAGVPVAQRVFGPADYLRPAFIEPYGCERVLIEGVRVRGAPFWQIHPVLCRHVIVRGIDILGRGPNNDGCDPESCSDVLIDRVTFDTGDDCIAIKSGRNADGRRVGAPSERIVIRDCVMREGHGGITVGSEISGGVRDVFAERCRLDSPSLNVAVRFKNNARRGGVLERIHVRDLTVGEVKQAVIAADFHYEEGAAGRYTPVLRDVTIERVTATRAGRALDVQGLPGAPIERLTIRDCRFDGVTRPSIVADTRGLVLSGNNVNGAPVASL